MLKTVDLTHIYMQNSPFEFKALDNINLEIKKGIITGIIGPVGGGKSTLIQHFNAILKPTFGKVLVDGEDLNDTKTNLKKIRQKVGLVFQFPETQLFGENIFEDVAFGPRNMGLSEKEVNERVEEALSWVEISFKESKIRSPFSLSGSQMRKVALASIIALHPEVLILDEPTVGLDPKSRKNLLEKIKLLKDNWNLTIILVSHGIEELVYLIEEIIIIKDGKVFLKGEKKEIFSRSNELIRLGLGIPIYTELLINLKKYEPRIKDDFFTLEETKKEILKLWNF